MIDRKKFRKKLSITQGRHLRIINQRIQIFPEKNWKNELKLFNLTKLKFIEWVVSEDNFKKNPICKINGYKIINKYLKKNKVKCRSIDLDFIVKENPLKFSKKKIKTLIKEIENISLNATKIGVKYLIFPFLENSSPTGKFNQDQLILILNEIRKKVPNKLFLLLETDLKPIELLTLIKKMKNKIFINYDLGNSASKNYNFNEEKKYFKFVKNIHLKDRIKNGSTVRFGYGNANFKKMFTFLMKNKNNYDFNLQPARSKSNEDIREIKLNIEYIENLLMDL
jgi:L-ribulose-5-phosphate 3-epimerase